MSESGGDHVLDDSVEAHVPREGLPRDYRMRADRHYVDQLAASSSAQPVRMIPVAALDGADADASGKVRHLIESIRRHGIIQPLHVRREDGRYTVIAGRKRLLAATTLRLNAVPCLVHDVTDAEASAIAAADNLRGVPLDGHEAGRADKRPIAALVADVIDSLESVGGRPGGYEALLNALAAKALADTHEGEARFERLPQGIRLTIVLQRSV